MLSDWCIKHVNIYQDVRIKDKNRQACLVDLYDITQLELVLFTRSTQIIELFSYSFT